jgi:putative transposase
MARADEEQARGERARAVGLFRYSLIREAADPRLSTKQRGVLVRALADAEHVGPFGQPVRVSRPTLDRWIRAWRTGGFDALVPTPRRVQPRTPAEVLQLAAALKREAPARTAAQVAAILRANAGWSPTERTLQRHFARLELNTRPDGSTPAAFGRFEADAPNELWTGDALHGPVIAGRKAILFAFIDDHSRALVGHRWGHAEDTVRLEAALRAALAARGVPQRLYVDNGSAFVDAQLLRACASLGIRLVHSRPGKPAGRGKIERVLCATRRPVASPAEPGGTRREVPGSDGSPGAERLRGQEHAS